MSSTITYLQPEVYPAVRTTRREQVRAAIAALALGVLVLFLQWNTGCYRAELAAHPDEPAHYVTGLMLHDYALSGALAHPVRFAENFYLHYPKMSLGHWPPGFYMIQAAWTLLFSTSETSVLLLMAFLTALLVWTVFRTTAAEFGVWLGFALAALLALTPMVQEYGAMLMTEIPVALFCLWAALAFGRYIQDGRARYAVWFGILSSMAIMTKGSGLALAFVPVIAIPLTRRWDLLRRPATWASAGLVALLCAPWYILTFRMAENGWFEAAKGGFFPARALPYNLRVLATTAGPVIFAFCCIGIAVAVLLPWRRRGAPAKWASLAGLVGGVVAFQSLIPASLDARHLITAAAPLLMFLPAAVIWLSGRLPGRLPASAMAPALVLLLAIAFAASTGFAMPRIQPRGYSPMVQDLLARFNDPDSVFLVSSQYEGEGAVISEVARLEKRPGHIVLRASKVLAQSQWTGRSYRLLYPDAAAVMRFLESVPVRILVMDNTPGTKDHLHHRQLEAMLAQYPNRWRFVGKYPKDGRPRLPGQDMRVYELVSSSAAAPGRIRVDLTPMLGRALEK